MYSRQVIVVSRNVETLIALSQVASEALASAEELNRLAASGGLLQLADLIHARGAECDAGGLEEFRRRSASGEDPDKIVGQLANLSADIDQCAAGAELRGDGVEQHVDFARIDMFLNASCIAVLEPAELGFAVGEGDLVACLMRDAHGGFRQQ